MKRFEVHFTIDTDGDERYEDVTDLIKFWINTTAGWGYQAISVRELAEDEPTRVMVSR